MTRAARVWPSPAPWLGAPLRLALGLALTGCGSQVPLWHGPHTASAGDVQFGGGASTTFLLGSPHAAIRDAQQTERQGSAPDQGSQQQIPAAYARGALALAGAPPGLAPGVAARVGLGAAFEAGLSYTGRSGRLDVRRSFDLGRGRALSLGVGAQGLLAGQPSQRQLPSFPGHNVRGFGFDVPVLLGVRSADRRFAVWGGARAGLDVVQLGPLGSEPKDVALGGDVTELRARRFYAGPSVGASVGTRYVRLVAELSGQLEALSGRFGDAEASMVGFSLSPSTALWFLF